MSWKRKTI